MTPGKKNAVKYVYFPYTQIKLITSINCSCFFQEYINLKTYYCLYIKHSFLSLTKIKKMQIIERGNRTDTSIYMQPLNK